MGTHHALRGGGGGGGGGGGQRYPSCIAGRCYQCAHLWSKGGTEGLHLLIYLCCNASWVPIMHWGGGEEGGGRGGGGGVRGTHHALQVDVINVLTCGQKEELRACTCLYTCAAMHHGGTPPFMHPPRGGPPHGQGGWGRGPPPPPPVDRRTETLKTLPSRYFVCGNKGGYIV